jgi:hypothetical protein
MGNTTKKDYFRTLGVERGASEDEIKRAYHRLARKYHPDVNPGNERAEARFKEISEAYAVLGDPEKRRAYESSGVRYSNGQRQTTRSRPSPRPHSPKPPPAGIRIGVSRSEQSGRPPGVAAGLDVTISGLTAGLGIAGGLLGGLDRLLSSAGQAPSERQSRHRSKRDADKKP